MKAIISSLFLAALLAAPASNAASVDSVGAALGVCKAQISQQYEGLSQTKTKKIRELRNRYSFKMAIKHNDQREVVVCEVARADGAVSINP